ncbi:D-tagatose-bisphosphate aldolase, class II, non-catalytic subunit [Streptomyces sp. DSM 41982]|uniref:D-tagatose-bisphosphate aldolase, class II, non-catalytic subunit n=1 Tax=Streptomyces evansiae TaxID=3075535 RepID=A0ABD5E0T4_9ACTN|nr:D-tagatose-bisphosphate aldolase, class II, non-catalytic subunit [Streptomyces sp. DSM 41982]MDT0415066.1 D-tagatose-bisphosphate aldolase, class II, non-catalytic subunit [Streptomyces sp. DSM 41982]
MAGPLDELVRDQKAGLAHGVTSVCSAHPLVLEAAVLQAVETGTAVLIEATSNQVDQYGGYTGLDPAGFRDLVLALADRLGLPRERVVLGGDHLGPNRWRDRPEREAMAEADDLVRAYVAAGFTKIHLDCSFACAGESLPLPDAVVARRAVRLVRVAEEAAGAEAGRMRYVIGTEVPVPGGADHALDGVPPTPAPAAGKTLETHRAAFAAAGLGAAWERVMALVVQPGVEFGQRDIADYRGERTRELRHVLDEEPGMVFEAHSTDYQLPGSLARLVRDHWAVLKVGPALTFALREALFALTAIEEETVGTARSGLVEVVDRRMREEPGGWAAYSSGSDARALRLDRLYGYSDRVRYYWTDPEIAAAQRRLFENLGGAPVPLALLSAHLPAQYARVRSGVLAARPHDLVIDRVRDVLRTYAAACAPRPKEYA